MKAEYLTLTDGRKVRIEWNMNALGEWSRITGKEMTDLGSGKASVSDMRTIAWCAASEGERLDGKEFADTELEFGALINMQGIVEFSKILTQQTLVAEQKKNSAPNRSPRIFFRRKG